MASASTLSTFTAFMKELYDGPGPEDLAKKDHPFLSMVKRKDGFGGEHLKVPVKYGHPQGRSRTFANAQTNASAGSREAFEPQPAQDYGVITVDALSMKRSKGNAMAFAELKSTEIDGIIEEVGNSAGRSLYRSGSGSIGQIATGGISTDTVTLERATQARHFEVNMVVQMDSVDGGGTVHSGTLTVSSVDRSAGTVTFTQNVTTGIASAAAGDYIFVDGDYDGGTGEKFTGLAAYLPLTAPSPGTTLWNLDQGLDPDRLAGMRRNTPGIPIHQNLMLLADDIYTFNGFRPTHAFINPKRWQEMAEELGDKKVFDDSIQVTYGFKAIMIAYSGGTISVVGDADCPAELGYVLKLDSWVLRHLNRFPHIVDDDGLVELRQASDDGIEARVRAWGNLVTNCPAANGVTQLIS